MWLKKETKSRPAPAHPGLARAADGRSAILETLVAACDAVGLEPANDAFEKELPASVRRLSGASLCAWAAGQAVAGRRAAVMAGRMTEARDTLAQGLPFVVHILGHSEIFALADTGAFVLVAKNVQEACDLALIAQRAAELSLTPGIVFTDAETARSVQSYRAPEQALLRAYLGRASDAIENPETVQKMLFGDSRKRVPMLFDPDRPAGVHAHPDDDSSFRGVAARGALSKVDEILSAAARDFATLTGRSYPAIGGNVDSADFVAVAQGSVVEELETAVQHLRGDGMRVGLLNLRQFRPFPAEAIAKALHGKRGVTVFDRTDAALAQDPPLLREIRGATEGRYHSAIYDRPSTAELLASIRNMTAGDAGRKRFYLGARFTDPNTRLPKLQVLQQTLETAYPKLAERSLTGERQTSPPQLEPSVELRFPSGGSGAFAASLLARCLPDGVRTWSDEGDAATMRAASFTIVRSATGGAPDRVHALLASSPALVHANLTVGGLIIVESDLEHEALWRSFPRELWQRLAERKPQLVSVPSRKIVADLPHGDDLAIFAILGCYIDRAKLDVRTAVKRELEVRFGAHPIVADILRAMERGAAEARDVDWRALASKEGPPIAEPDAPWTVRELKRADGTVFDPARFWDSTGFFYETGRLEHVVADPFTATGIVPARSSAAHDASMGRYRLPHLIAERCNGCGLCWTLCPDSALPPTLQTFGGILASVSADLPQVQRASANLAKIAHRLYAKDELKRYLVAGPLFQEAIRELTEKTGVGGEEFNHVVSRLANFPLIRTKIFFEDAEAKEKGSGRVLSIALNPLACKGCQQCVTICPEKALESLPQTREAIEMSRTVWELLPKLPDPPEPLLEGPRYQFLARKTYHSLVGGDLSFPGTGAKTAVHILASTIEGMMRPKIRAHVEKLTGLVDSLKKKVQDRVGQQLRINDFDSFGRKLGGLRHPRLTLDDLTAIMKDAPEAPIDREAMARMTRSIEELQDQKSRFESQARLGMVLGDGLAWMCAFPYNPCAFPWVRSIEAPAMLEGILAGVAQKAAEDAAAIRRAETELDGPSGTETPAPPIVIALQDRFAEFESVSRWLRSGLPVKILVVNTLDCDARLSDEIPPKEFGLLALTHDAFVLQSTTSEPDHLIRGLRDGLASPRPALFHVYAPDPQRHGLPSYQGIEQARLAVRARVFPMFRYDEAGLSLEGNPEEALSFGDWAVREARFRRHFRRVAKSDDAPHVDYADVRYAVSKEILAAGRKREAAWALLRQLALKPLPPTVLAGPPDTELRERLTRNLMAMCGLSGESEKSRMSVKDFVERLRNP